MTCACSKFCLCMSACCVPVSLCCCGCLCCLLTSGAPAGLGATSFVKTEDTGAEDDEVTNLMPTSFGQRWGNGAHCQA